MRFAEMTIAHMPEQQLRVALMTIYPANYRAVSEWADRHGHNLVIVVTLPVTAHPRAAQVVAGLPKDGSLLMSNRLLEVVAPALAVVRPDLLISAGYPRLIPPEILELPRLGAVNVHPSALPAGRGPNPIRLLYEGANTLGTTLHRTEKEFDTGAILSRRERPLPEDLTGESVFRTWMDLFHEVLEEGTARAIAGEPGEAQDESHASYAGRFTDEETLLDLTEPVATLRRRAAALNLLQPTARAILPDGREVVVARIEPAPDAGPGRTADGYIVQVGDGSARLTTR
jgi:methionyl-tRNA formyltransferase